MSSTFIELTQDKLNAAVADHLIPKIFAIMNDRKPGHCMRITDLANEIMELICAELLKQHSNRNIFILGGYADEGRDYRITSTKLVELRNPLADGQLRPPLLVFIPTSLRTSAEDSFGVATFEELSFPNIYNDIIESLLERIPPNLLKYVHDIFGILSEENWLFADDVAKVRYLLTALENGIDGETLGASLYELALIPDFKLFEDTSLISGRIRRNLDSVRILIGSFKSIRGRIIDLGLKDKTLQNQVCQFFEQRDFQEPEVWTRKIALKKEWWSISFDKWTFIHELALDKIQINLLQTDLPTVQQNETNEQLFGLIGQQVLIPNERHKMTIVFEVNPHPTKVKGLGYFTVQLISQNSGPVGKSKKVKLWIAKRMQCRVSLLRLDKIDFEEGWHYIRVLPWTNEGDPIPLVDNVDDASARQPYESEPFYVLPGGSIEEDPPQRAIQIEKSLEHARLRLQLTALNSDRNPDEIAVSSIDLAEGNKARKSALQENMLIKFGRDGAFQIPLSRILKSVEQRILLEPKHPSGWRMQINMGSSEHPSKVSWSLPVSTAMQSFLAARADLFDSIGQNSTGLVMQGVSILDLESKSIAYTESYLDLIRGIARQAESSSSAERQTHLLSLRNVLAIDSIHVIITDFRGKHREAVLLSPTHPLRTLWLSAWVKLGKNWISKLKTDGKDHIGTVRTALLDRLQPNSFPVGIPVEDGRIFTSVDNLNPFWGLYAPTKESNTRGLMAEICTALGLPEPAIIGSNISSNILTDKIERYICQHPYTKELAINIFNPGSGTILKDSLIALQEKPEYVDLRYDIRLFSQDPETPSLGEALEFLLKPESIVNEAADAFSTTTGSHLFPKLKLAKHPIDEFHSNPQIYKAHISILLDVFPAEELSIAEKSMELVPMNSMIQAYETEFVDDDSGTYWHKYPIVGFLGTSDEQEGCYDLLASLNKFFCFALSAVAASGGSFRAVPIVTLGLDVARRELIYEIHQISDWVFTIDRHMGIEFFDHGGKKNRPDYLIDFVPGSNSQTTHNFIISSRSTEELEAILRPVMQKYGLSVDGAQSVKILAYLRSLSGQLALKLISSPNQQAEALGLALARLYLEYQGALSNQIIVPLDSHTDLYRSAGETDYMNDPIGLQRTDLALFDLDLGQRIITCNLVEVKCYSQVGDFSAFNQLKDKISAQIQQSERILQKHFDPSLKIPDRPDRQIKSLEFVQILKFYLGRSLRYDIFDEITAREAQAFLQSIEYGYSLQFRRAALIFDFEKNGSDPPEVEMGIEFHRIGKDLIQSLLDSFKPSSISPESEDTEKTVKSLSDEYIADVPKLQSASFIPSKRERTTTWSIDDQPQKRGMIITDEQIVDDKDLSEPQVGDSVQEGEKPSSPQPDKTDVLVSQTDKGSTKIQCAKESKIVPYDVMLGVVDSSPQYGLLGEVTGRKIALDLNHTHTISLFGVQGGGKSYTLGTIIEMASISIKNLNVLPSPLATVIFHYSPTQDYEPEFTSMIHPNTVDEELKILSERYQARPQALKDIMILTPSDKVDKRRSEYPDIEVLPIAFAASELKAAHWKFLMGAIGSQSMYMRQINLIMRALRDNLTLEALRNGIKNSSLSDHLKELAKTRLQFARVYINENQKLRELIRPGRLIIVDLRDEYIEKNEALGLFVVMLQILSDATFNGKSFNKLVVFDEAHKYIENDDLLNELVEVVREMRHKGTSIMVASQDPPSVPVALIELSTQIIMHKFNSPAWLKHIQKANTSLSELTSEKMGHLNTGEAYVWSSNASDDSFTRRALKIKCRPRVTKHGGGTKTAI